MVAMRERKVPGPLPGAQLWTRVWQVREALRWTLSPPGRLEWGEPAEIPCYFGGKEKLHFRWILGGLRGVPWGVAPRGPLGRGGEGEAGSTKEVCIGFRSEERSV